MNIKRTVLISVAVVMMISSIAMVSAADTDNITAATEDCRAGELKLADANIKSDTSIEIHALADTKEDEIAKGPSDVLAENGNSTNPAITIYDNGKYFGDKSITVNCRCNNHVKCFKRQDQERGDRFRRNRNPKTHI